MPNNGIFRNVNILKEINSVNTSELIEIYQPGWLSPLDVVNNFKYSGFITSLRLTVDISSITELQTIPSDILASDEIIAENNRGTFEGNQKKCLRLFMKTYDTPLTRIVDVFLFNQRPYYYVDILKYFTSSVTFDVAPDTQLFMQMIEVGSGILSGNDSIILLGSVIEESPVYNQSFLLAE